MCNAPSCGKRSIAFSFFTPNDATEPRVKSYLCARHLRRMRRDPSWWEGVLRDHLRRFAEQDPAWWSEVLRECGGGVRN